MDKLLKSGEVYFNTIEFFRKNDVDDFLRGDFAEGLKYSPLPNFRIPSLEEYGIKFKNAKINGDTDISHLYSMYMVTTEFWEGNIHFDKRILEFGDYALIIKPREFLEKVIKASKYEIKYGPAVYYRTPTIPLSLNPFSKREEFKYQNEFRFVINSSSKDPIKIKIGDISDIATMIPTETLLKIKFLKK
ncbi:hypothetical protein [Arthrospiribacter ruber]|uniref:Uncharacterized protein n=1 Tax=Arthrospiribacter ruber TaxID=2487934 RepID=A0A951IZZ5_9BACT|nr:hypothetical protein [Arthrospiribacter ruber]MBW3469036.1 hypothetical protein [Arthrospiribacter ruber]